jgi:hypothetical protein
VCIFFFRDVTDPSGSGLLQFRGFTITLTLITFCGLLWTSDQPDADSCTWQHTTITRDKPPCSWRFRTNNPHKRAVTDSRLRARGESDPLKCVYWLEYAYPPLLISFVFGVIYFKLQQWRKDVWLSLKHRNLSTGLYQKLRDAAKSARDKICSDLWRSFRLCFKWKELTTFSLFLVIWRETFFFDFYLADRVI